MRGRGESATLIPYARGRNSLFEKRPDVEGGKRKLFETEGV